MDVNPSTNSAEAERCLDILVNQLIMSQYWQGTIRLNQIRNCVLLFNRYLRLSGQQDTGILIQEIRNRVASEVIFNEFLNQLNMEGINSNSLWQIYKDKFIKAFKKLLNSHLTIFKCIEKLESVVFNMLPEALKNSIIPTYRRPLILLYSFNIILFIMRLTIFNSRPIFHIRTKPDYYSRNVFNASSGYNYPTFLEIVHETLMFFLNVLTSIIPLALPIITLHFMNGQHIQI